VLLLHAKGDVDSMRAGGCAIHSVVGYYAKLCNSSSKASEITRGKPKKKQREVRAGSSSRSKQKVPFNLYYFWSRAPLDSGIFDLYGI
jgi:hypothetical protein